MCEALVGVVLGVGIVVLLCGAAWFGELLFGDGGQGGEPSVELLNRLHEMRAELTREDGTDGD